MVRNHELMDPVIVVQQFREAGHVTRCHTVPHHGEYTNASHSWHVANLILLLHPGPGLNLVKAALWHDCHERWIGDIPSTAQWLNAAFSHAVGALKDEVDGHLRVDHPLLPEEERWLKAADVLELYLWCMDQANLGNNHIAGFARNCLNWWHHQGDQVPPELRDFLDGYSWLRTRDDQLKRGVSL